MNIKGITQAIKMALDARFRTPASAISNVILLCGLMKRPGLSAIMSLTKITELLQLKGIPTWPNTDGTPNLILIHDFILMNEIYRAISMDMKITTVVKPGSIAFQGTGTVNGGVVSVTGINTNISGHDGIGL